MSTSNAIEPRSNGGHQLNPLTSIKDHEIDTLYRLAKGLAMSGFFKDARQAEQAFAKLLFGRDLGLGATQAMTGIHIVEGKPELSANLQAAMVRAYVGPAGERYDYRTVVHSHEECSLEFFRRYGDGEWESLGVSTFTIEDAKRAELVKPRGNWAKYPKNMVFARALSNGVAFMCPEVTYGHRIYAEGELSEGHEGPAPAAQSRPPELPAQDQPQLPPTPQAAPEPEVIEGTAAEPAPAPEPVDATTIPEGPAVSDAPPLEPAPVAEQVETATSAERKQVVAAFATVNLSGDTGRPIAQRLLRLITGFQGTDRLPRSQVKDVLATVDAIRRADVTPDSVSAMLDVIEDLPGGRTQKHANFVATLEKGITAGEGQPS